MTFALSMTVVVTATILLFNFFHPSSAHDLDDYCASLVALHVLKPDELLDDDSHYLCHPAVPNAYVVCVIGRPVASKKTVEKLSKGKANDAKSTMEPQPGVVMAEVKHEQEVVCNPGTFFNSVMNACVHRALSNCAGEFATRPPRQEQLLCEAFRQTLPLNSASVADLICHGKMKHAFVVCPLNAVSATLMKCVNNTYFNQAKGECVEREEDSDCPIDWLEMGGRNNPSAGLMRKMSRVNRCICDTLLARCREQFAYAAYPDNPHKFLICVRNREIHVGYCAPGLFWNDNAGMCANTPFRKPVPHCAFKPPVMPIALIPPFAPIPPVVTANPNSAPRPDSQHRRIDREITERQRCECHMHLQRTGKEAVYICDPENADRFLVCGAPNRVVCQLCAGGMRWNRDVDACAPIRECDPWLCAAPNPASTLSKKPPTMLPSLPPTYPPTMPPWTPAPTPVPYCKYLYEYHPEKMNWYSAMRACQANHGSLVTVPSMEVQQLLRQRFGSTRSSMRVWVGASDKNREGIWEWVNGEHFGFTNWYRGQPTSYKEDEDCLMFNYKIKGGWSDEDCDLNKPYICQTLVCSTVGRRWWLLGFSGLTSTLA